MVSILGTAAIWKLSQVTQKKHNAEKTSGVWFLDPNLGYLALADGRLASMIFRYDTQTRESVERNVFSGFS